MDVRKAGVTQLQIKRGDPWSRSWAVRLGDGTPCLNLFGSTFRAQLRRSADHPVAAVFAVTADPTVGRLTLALTWEQTQILSAPEYLWDVQGLDAQGHPLATFLGGTATVSKDITHD